MITERTGPRVVIAGGSGLIGRHLTRALLADGWAVDVLTRDPGAAARVLPSAARTVAWVTQPTAELAAALSDADGVVNLSGEPVAPRPWTPGRRRAIVASRVDSTAALVAAIAQLPADRRPRVLVNASGIDVYTGRDASPADEAAPPTRDFLGDASLRWEAAALDAEALGVRVVLIRTGFVLSPDFGLMRLLTLPFRLFLGGRLGSGRQWFSWIHVDDLVAAYRAALTRSELRGPINATAPEAVRQRELAAAIGRALHRPSWFPTPAWPIRLVLGGQATLILDSRRVAPVRLESAGFVFRYPDLDGALADVLGRDGPGRGRR